MLSYFLSEYRFRYAKEYKADWEIKKGLITTIERMCPSMDEREKIDRQLDIFGGADMMFGMDMAIQMRTKKQPGQI